MNPNDNLREQLNVSESIRELWEADEPNYRTIACEADRLADLVLELDEWRRSEL